MIKLLISFKTHENKFLLLLFILGIILRCLYTYYVYNNTGTSNWADDWEYLSMGKQIADGNWNPKEENAGFMVVGPVIPIVVALFTLVFTEPVIPFFIYNVVVTSLLILVLFFLGKEVFNKKIGTVLAIWGLFFIETYKYCPHILKEPTLFLLVPLTIFFIIRTLNKEKHSILYIFLASLSFTILIHTDERFFIYLPVFFLFFFLIKPPKLLRSLKMACLWSAFVLLLMVPWTIRNYIVFDQVVILTPRTTAFTSKLFGDNISGIASHFNDDLTKQKLIDYGKEEAIKFGDQYNIFPREYSSKEARCKAFINFWQPTYFKATFIQYGYRPQKWSLAHNISGLLFYGVYLPFYFMGFFILIKKQNFIGLSVAFIPIIHSLMHAYMVWPLERYRSPITFIVVMVGIWVLTEMGKQIKQKFS